MAKPNLSVVPTGDLFIESLKDQDNLIHQHFQRRRWSIDDWRKHLIKHGSKNGWRSLPVAIQNCEAYFDLTSSAKVILDRCFCEAKPPRDRDKKVRGFTTTEGYSEFLLPYNMLRAIGIGSDDTIARSIKLLKEVGFLEQIGETKIPHPNRYKLSDKYREWKSKG
jgi:hypothetical protein